MKLMNRNGIWWFTTGTGKERIRQSTGKRDYAEAMEVAKRMELVIGLESTAERVTAAAAIANSLRGEADAVRREIIRTPLETLWKKVGGYTGSGKRPIKPSSVREATRAWRLFLEYAKKNRLEYAEDVTPDQASEYLRERGEGRATETSWVYCRAMFAKAGISPNPFEQKPPVRKSDIHHEPLTRAQIAKLLAEVDRLATMKGHKADAAEFALFVRFLIYTGLRLGDAVTIRREQIDFQVDPPMLSRKQGKVGKNVRFPLHPAIAGRIGRGDGYVFPLLAAAYQAGHKVLPRRMSRLFQKLGIIGEKYEYSAHSLRTTCATISAEAGVPMAVIQSWLGHSSQMVTRIYTRVESDRQKAAAMAKFPDLG